MVIAIGRRVAEPNYQEQVCRAALCTMELLIAGVHSSSLQLVAGGVMTFFARFNGQIRSLFRGVATESAGKKSDRSPLKDNHVEAVREEKYRGSDASGECGARDSAIRNRLLGQTGIEGERRLASPSRGAQSGRAAGKSDDTVAAIFHSLISAQNVLGTEALSLRMDELENRSDPAKRARLLANRKQQARNRAVLDGLILVGQQKIEKLNSIQASGRPLRVQQDVELADHRRLVIEMRMMRCTPH